MKCVIENLIFLMNYAPYFTLDSMLTLILLDLGIPAKDVGFRYLKNSILLYYEDSSRLLVKEIYPAAALMSGFHVESAVVEQAIRRSIAYAWKYQDEATCHCYFLGWMRVSKPSNADFIASIAEFLTIIQDSSKYNGL